MADEFQCPRRAELGAGASVFKLPTADHWRLNPADGRLGAGLRACSYCGSAHPEDFFAAIERGEELGPTDKDYKVYVGKTHKFYFQHLDVGQRKLFVELLNNQNKIKIGDPGHFYVLPFFCKRGAP